MGANTLIGWTDHTWNPWVGCVKVSAGCKACYMYRDQARYGLDPRLIRKTARDTFRAPLRASGKNGMRPGDRVFGCSWSDFFIAEADEWRPEAWDVIRARPDLTFQLLTKRPENILARLPADWGDGWPNVWLGVSVENAHAKPRIDTLRAVPARLRFLSVEPLLDEVRLSPEDLAGIGWVILGGESGPTARPCDLAWLAALVEDAAAANVPCFVKQIGQNARLDGQPYPARLAGTDPAEWPEALRVQQFPTTTPAPLVLP